MELLHFSKNDIPLNVAISAHRGTSFDPERRGEQEREGYVSYLQSIVDRAEQYRTDENEEDLIDFLDAFKKKYLKLELACLHSRSNVLSPMITGPSKFPTSRNSKRCNWYENKVQALIDFKKKWEGILDKKFNPHTRRGVSSDDENAVEKLEKKLQELQENQERMKAINKIVRNTKTTKEQKRQKLKEYGLPESLLTPDVMGEVGFPSFRLRNNNANIKRTKERLETLKRQRQDTTKEETFEGVTIIDNVEENRVQVIFEERVDKELYQLIRHKGFVFSRKNKAFQRKRSSWAMREARDIVKIYLPKESPEEKEERSEPSPRSITRNLWIQAMPQKAKTASPQIALLTGYGEQQSFLFP